MRDGRSTSSRSASTCVISSCAAKPSRFRRTAIGAEYILPVAQALREKRGDELKRPAAEIANGAPPDAPAGDKDKHIDGLIENARAALGAADFDFVVLFSRDRMLADIRNDLEEFGVRFDNWYFRACAVAQRCRRKGARCIARERPCLREGRRHVVQVHGFR
jgi:arginyl-tRNA synthetase